MFLFPVKSEEKRRRTTDASISKTTNRRENRFVDENEISFDVFLVSEAKTLRTSTSVKRVELEKRQEERQERRKYLKGVASLRNTGEVRRLTQEELLEEAKLTGKISTIFVVFLQFDFVFQRKLIRRH